MRDRESAAIDAQRQARIEARRLRLAARESREEDGIVEAPEEEHNTTTQVEEVRPNSRARPVRRMDHQDTFGTRSSAAEGLVDAPTRKPRAGPPKTASAASNLDLDFASVERGAARMKRSEKMERAQPMAAGEIDKSAREERAVVVSHPAAITAAGARAAGKVLISDDEEQALHRLMIGPQEEADGLTGAGAGILKNEASGRDESVLGTENTNAIDAKAMDRLARQNDELRKLAEAQRRELQRLQVAAHASISQPGAAHSPAARLAVNAVADPWTGGLKERGVRRYLDAVAKVQAGVGPPAHASVAGDDHRAYADAGAMDDEGTTLDQEFEEHLQHLQWQRTAHANSKLPPSQAPVEAIGAAQEVEKSRRRAAAVSGKMTDEEEDRLRRQRREDDLKALGLDPAVGEIDLPRAAAAKISELEEELERLRREDGLEEEVEDSDDEGSLAPRDVGGRKVDETAASEDRRRWRRGGGAAVTNAVGISSSEDEDDPVVDEILEHEQHQAGRAGLGPEEAGRLARELGRLKAKLDDGGGDGGGGESVDAGTPEMTGSASSSGPLEGCDSLPTESAARSQAVAAGGEAQSGAGAGSRGWGSKLKNFFFGMSAANGSASQASQLTAAGDAAAQAPQSMPPVVMPPMATPSVQGSMKLSIKLASSAEVAGAAGADGAPKPVFRMMTALADDAELDSEDYQPWFDGGEGETPMSAPVADATDAIEEEPTPRVELVLKQQPAPIRIAANAKVTGVEATGAGTRQAMLEADALLDAFAPPPRKPPLPATDPVQSLPASKGGQLVERDLADDGEIRTVEDLMQRVKTKIRQIELGDEDPKLVREVRVLKAQVARALAAMEREENPVNWGNTPREDVAGVASDSTHVGATAAACKNTGSANVGEEATPRMLEQATPRLDGMAAHVAQQRVQSKAPGAVPPMLNSFFQTLGDAELPPPPSQRSNFSEHVAEEGEMDDFDTMSMASMATAVVDPAALQRKRHARPAPRHQRPLNVSSVITPGAGGGRGVVGDSPTTYREGGQQDLWLNDDDDDDDGDKLQNSIRRSAAVSVTGSEQTRVFASNPAQLEVESASDAPDQLLMLRDRDGQDVGPVQQTQKEKLRQLQLRLLQAAAPNTTSMSNSFRTEYSDDLGSVRSRDLMPSPKAKQVAVAGSEDGHDLHGVETWAAGDDGREDRSEAVSQEVPTSVAKVRRKQRAQERVAGGKTIAGIQGRGSSAADTWDARSAQEGGARPGTAGSAPSGLAVDDNVFEDSDEEAYDEGHAGITQRQDQILAENMALVMGDGDEGAGSGDEGLSGVDADAGGEMGTNDEGHVSQTAHSAAAFIDRDIEEEDLDLDPLMAEMKSKARLRAQRARAQEPVTAVTVADPAVAGGIAALKQRSVKELEAVPSERPTFAMSVGKKAREAVHADVGSLDDHALQNDSGSSEAMMPLQLMLNKAPVLEGDETSRLSLQADLPTRKFDASGMSGQKQDAAHKGSNTAGGDDSVHRPPNRGPAGARTLPVPRMELDSEESPFSPDFEPGMKKSRHNEDVPLFRVERRPFSASTQVSRDQSPTPSITDEQEGTRGRDVLPLHNASSDAGADVSGASKETHTARALTPPSARSSTSHVGGAATAVTAGRDESEGEEEASEEGTSGRGTDISQLGSKGKEETASWIQENEQVEAMKERAARPLSQRDEVRNYSAILTSQLGFLGPLPSVTLPDEGSDSEDSRGRGKKGKSKKSKWRKAKAGYDSGGRSPSSQASLDSAASSTGFPSDSRENSARSRDSSRHGTPVCSSKGGRTKESKWKRHDGDAESGAESSGSDEGLPRGFGQVAVKDLMGKSKSRKAEAICKPTRQEGSVWNAELSGDDCASTARGSNVGSSEDVGQGADVQGRKDARRGVRYEVREMPDGTKKRIEVKDGTDLFWDERRDGGIWLGGELQRHGSGNRKEQATSHQSAGRKEREESMMEKAERLQREARVMREAAEHSRRQEVLREAAERDKVKAQRQVEELQKQLHEARTGKAVAMHAQVMQVRMGLEASGEDELNAYLMRPSKTLKTQEHSPRQQEEPLSSKAQQSVSVAGSSKAGKGNPSKETRPKVKTAPALGPEDDRVRVSPRSAASKLASTLPVGSRRGIEMVPRLQGTGKSSISSGGLSRSADEEWGGDVEEEEEDAPPELLHRLHSVAACLIQQSWRKQRRRPTMTRQPSLTPSRCLQDNVGGSGAHADATVGCASGMAGTLPETASLSATAPSTIMLGASIGTGASKGRSSTAHTMVGASATVEGLVPASIRALHVALSRSGLADPVEAFVWLDRSGKNGVSLPALAQGLKALCATNIDAGQVIFDLNPKAADGRVSAHEFVSALQGVQSSVMKVLGAGAQAGDGLQQKVAAARARLAHINAAVHQTLHRSVMSSKDKPSALNSSASASTPAPVSAALERHGGAAPELEVKKADVLRQARSLFKRCGFQNVAEVIVYLESFADDAPAPPQQQQQLQCQHLLAALKELRLTRELAGKDLVFAMGKRAPSDVLSQRDLLQHLSWECAGLAADAWKPHDALHAARAEKKKLVARIKGRVHEAELRQKKEREVELRRMAEGTRAAKEELAALRKLSKARPADRRADSKLSGAYAGSRQEQGKDEATVAPVAANGSDGVDAAAPEDDAHKLSLPPLGRLGGGGGAMSQTMPASIAIGDNRVLYGGGPAAARMKGRAGDVVVELLLC